MNIGVGLLYARTAHKTILNGGDTQLYRRSMTASLLRAILAILRLSD